MYTLYPYFQAFIIIRKCQRNKIVKVSANNTIGKITELLNPN